MKKDLTPDWLICGDEEEYHHFSHCFLPPDLITGILKLVARVLTRFINEPLVNYNIGSSKIPRSVIST